MDSGLDHPSGLARVACEPCELLHSLVFGSEVVTLTMLSQLSLAERRSYFRVVP